MCFPRRPPEETKTERVIGVASNPDLRLRGLPDEPRTAKPRSLTKSKKNLLDKVAGEKLEVATTRSKTKGSHNEEQTPSSSVTTLTGNNTYLLHKPGFEPGENLRASPPPTQRRPRRWRWEAEETGGSGDRKRTRQPPERGVNAEEESWVEREGRMRFRERAFVFRISFGSRTLVA